MSNENPNLNPDEENFEEEAIPEDEGATAPVAEKAAGPGDDTLQCLECGKDFTFAAEEKQEYSRRGYQPPKRCGSCRQLRRRKTTAKPRRGGAKRFKNNEPQRNDEAQRHSPERNAAAAPQREARPPAANGNASVRKFGPQNWRLPSEEPALSGSYVQQAEVLKTERPIIEGEEPPSEDYSFLDGFPETAPRPETVRTPFRVSDEERAQILAEEAEELAREGVKTPQASQNPQNSIDRAPPVRRQEKDDENFGNSIYYQGPGVNPRVTARDENPQYAPWEGAHGMLLTHHEQKMKNKMGGTNQQSGDGPANRPRKKMNPSRNNRGPQGKPGQRNSEPSRSANKSRKASFDIVCNECGKATQVPFRPLPNRPVYCRECYGKVKQRDKKSTSETPPSNSEPGASEDSGQTT